MEVSKHSKEVLKRDAMDLQQGVRDATYGEVGDVQKSFVDAPKAVIKSLHSLVGHSQRGDMAKAES